ncbi:MAG: LysM peptidoglycan-binding domain-containing protein [Candidatus Zixiibacteriota bacterium]|nr:MAG: LysM peptidoglycan-binding domain-containing protein [candidate division Zixibacteria bacterium]
MKPTKSLVPILVFLVVVALAGQSHADISNSAALYLRIAPGARAAGMGEAYVAIADDATSTHWNPAGLGAYPLSPGWLQASVPSDLQPLSGAAALKTRRGHNYAAYDIWAMTAKGLARFDNKDWYTYEEFGTKTDQTLEEIVSSYFNLTDPDQIAAVVKEVARFNAAHSYGYLDSLRTKVMKAVPESYSGIASLTGGFDSLVAGYDRCLILWEQVDEVEAVFEEGMTDGDLSEKEIDRINFAVEKSRARFLPEQLYIGYSALIGDQLLSVASTREFLVVAGEGGIYTFNGKQWQTYTTANGLPSGNITALAGNDLYVFVATDKGIVFLDGYEMTLVGAEGELPEGNVSSVVAGEGEEVWAVVNNVLYRFNGEAWLDHFEYQVVIDDTPEKIAEKLVIYGTEAEKDAFLKAMMKLNSPGAPDAAADSTAETEQPGQLALEPGKVIKAPFTVGFKGNVAKIYMTVSGRLWVGTSYGIIYRDGDEWELAGYREYTVTAGDRLSDIVALPGTSPDLDVEGYKAALMDINDLQGEQLTPGQVIRVYKNPTAAPVYDMTERRGHTFFSTSLGMLEHDGTAWGRVDVHGLEDTEILTVQSLDDELWFSGKRKVVYRANSKTDISMMYVKWLPELADDLYYAFASLATHVEGWGTFGGNFTYISYGTITRTGSSPDDIQGTFDSYDFALTGSWGTSVTDKLKTGVSAKLLVSRLSPQGADQELGEGSATGFAVDVGLIYQWTPRLNLGMAITNLGPDLAYIDASQADPLPRNLALGFAYKLLQTDYYHLLVTAEVNKSLVGVDDGFSEELEQLVLNGGAEFLYSDILALRGGYVYDQEGDVKIATVGIGLGPLGIFKFDFAYIPSLNDVVLENTLRISLAIQP